MRLCKGAYKEPESVAYQSAREVDKSYVRCLNVLMSGDGYPMLATHDPRLIAIGEDRARWFEPCAPTSPTATSGTATSCAGWPSARPT
ncbi:hypothetical protein GCM10027452_43760 [Micromonospora halotolerans]